MFLGDVTRSSDYREIYAALDVLDSKAPQIMNIMNRNIERTITRDKSLIFYDVTNYYFETDRNDEDGIRKAGVSKENRKQPVVQMGLFLDRNSIPIAYDLHPGNTLDSLTLKPSMQKYIDRYDLENILIVADRGLCSGGNEIYIKEQGNDYLFARSVRKASKEQESLKEFKVAVLDDRCIFREMNENLQLLLDRLEIPFDFKVCKVHEISRKLKFSL